MLCIDNAHQHKNQEQDIRSDLEGKVALILGGGRGLGRAIAVAFAREGTRVCVVGPEALRLHQTVHVIHEMGGEGLAIPTRLQDLAEITRLTAETVARFGRIDILINAADGLLGGTFDHSNESLFQEALHRLFFHGLCLSLEAASYMTRSGGGRIISVLERTEQEPAALLAATAINAGLRKLTTELAQALKPHQILVYMIDPGGTRLPQAREQITARAPQTRRWTQTSAKLYEIAASRRWTTAQERIAAAAVYLASNELVSLTGAEIAFNGASLADDGW